MFEAIIHCSWEMYEQWKTDIGKYIFRGAKCRQRCSLPEHFHETAMRDFSCRQ
jgi:hypothetical protein